VSSVLAQNQGSTGVRAWIPLLALSFLLHGGAAEANPLRGDEGLPEKSVSSGGLQWSGARTSWDRRAQKVTLKGNASVRQEGELLLADEIEIDLKARRVKASGHCRFLTSDSEIRGHSLELDLDTKTGWILEAQVSNEKFKLSGARIEKRGPGRFFTQEGMYSTCVDCPQAWTLTGEDVDLEFEGYGFLKNVAVKVKDAPVAWLPYLVVPLKTQRQSGLLFPRLGTINNGATFVLPFFWAPSRSYDFTFGIGDYGGRGFRGELEARYQLSPRSGGRFSFYSLQDRTFEQLLATRGVQPRRSRWALDLQQVQELPWGIDQKLRITESSDTLYPSQIGDIRGLGEATNYSELTLSRSSDTFAAYVSARRYRNLISSDPDPTSFDPNTVQAFPSAFLSTNDQPLWGGRFFGGLSVGFSNFTRSGADFDLNELEPGGVATSPRHGIDPVRKAVRASVTPSLFTSLRPSPWLSISPGIEYRAAFYSFAGTLPSLSRGYPLIQTQIETRLERLYETSDIETPRWLHVIRPSILHSLIPFVNEDSSHPFLRQISYAQTQGVGGFNFDNLDIVPVGTSRTYNNYFLPLGHSLAFGVSSQAIRRRGRSDQASASYQRVFDFTASQTIDLRELGREPTDRQLFSRFQALTSLDFEVWRASFDYSYFPYAEIDATRGRNMFSVSAQYFLERSLHQRILPFERSFSLGYTYNRVGSGQTDNPRLSFVYSLNDYLVPSASFSYDLLRDRFLSMDGAFRFQSPSKCYRLEFSFSRYVCEGVSPDGFCQRFGVDFSLNLTGAGFQSPGEMAQGPAISR
jgi:LPS-assembly protein